MLRRAFIRFQLFLLPILGYTMSAREAAGITALLFLTGGIYLLFSTDSLMTTVCLLIMLGFIIINCMIYHRTWLMTELDAGYHEQSMRQQRESLQALLRKGGKADAT